jgi:hypothetical protein
MHSKMLDSLCRRVGVPELVEILSSRLSASELNSLLLEVFQQKSRDISPAELLKAYQTNRFVSPVDFDWLPFLQQELKILQFASNQGFESLELAPVSPLGTCSVVGTVHQHKVLTALRGTEVVADATNVLALESAVRRQAFLQKNTKSSDRVRLCTTHRHVRTPTIQIPGFTPHFKIFCLTTAGRDEGNFTFEKESVVEQLQFYMQLLTEQLGFDAAQISLLLKRLHTDGKDPVFDAVHDVIQKRLPKVSYHMQEIPQTEASYYQGLQFKILLHLNENAYDIGDGGLVNWTQQLLGNRKERCLISGIGTAFLYRLRSGN